MANNRTNKQIGKTAGGARVVKTVLIFSILTLGIVCGWTLYLQISGLKTELAILRRDVASLTTRERVNRSFDEVSTAQNKIQPVANVPTRTPVVLNNSDIQLIREFVKVPPAKPGVAQDVAVGDTIPETSLGPIPEPIVEKLPKLKGAKFHIGANSAIIISGPGSNRADVIILPPSSGSMPAPR